MKGRCTFCKEVVFLYTIKYGDLFDPDEPFDVCFPHERKEWPFNKSCEGSNTTTVILDMKQYA